MTIDREYLVSEARPKMSRNHESDVLDDPSRTLVGPRGPKASTDRLFEGGGEMGSLMRSFEWSKTALGPVSGWSQALKTSVGIVLRSPAPMHLYWGPQFVQLYNNAYRPMAGAKHPTSMGQPGRECWPEIWHIVGPKYVASLAGQPATWSEDQPLLLDRKGFLEVTYFKAAFIPVPDETTASGIGGVLTTLIETTEQVHSERQRKILQEIAKRAAGSHSAEQACATAAATLGENASDVPFCLFYLLSQDGKEARLVAESGFGPGSGLANPEIIDLTTPPAGAVGWPLASMVRTAATTVWKDRPERFNELPKGPWSQSPRVAIAVPLASPDRPHPYGVIIAGVSPHRELDEGYQAFFELVAGQVVTVINAGALVRAQAEAERARTWLFAQLMQAPVSVCILTGPELVYSLANSRYLEMVGRKEVVGKSLRAVYPELEQDSPVFRLWEGIFSSGVPYVAEEHCVAFDAGNGLEDRYYKFTGQPVRDATGKVTDIMVVAVDVTAQVLTRRRIESLVGELRQADQRKDEFLATLAHELRNPMAAISMALSLLESSGGDPNKSARYQATARRQMQALVRLVDDLLDISRITRGTVELRKERTSLAAIVHNAATVTRAAVEGRGHRFEVTVGAGAFPVDVDATRIEQVVVNLLINATKYTDPGGTLSVRLDREEVPGKAEAILRVRDSGRGIPADMLDSIFDIFVQVAPSLDRSTGGLGVGLTLVKQMVELHGGTVRAHSDGPGRGSEFVVRLALAPEALPDAQNAEVSARPLSAFTGRRRVLVVEDVEDVRNTLQEVLADLGHEVSVAVDGHQGVAKILELLPHVSFVDVGLPGIDGYEVARRVRASPGGDQLYLVALTGYDGSDVRARGKEAGFNLLLAKPVDMSELAKLVSNSRA